MKTDLSVRTWFRSISGIHADNTSIVGVLTVVDAPSVVDTLVQGGLGSCTLQII